MPHLRINPKDNGQTEVEELEEGTVVTPLNTTSPPTSPDTGQKRLDSATRRATAKLPPSFMHHAEVSTPQLSTTSTSLTLDTTGQHTLSWTEELSLKATPEAILPPGSCNLYLFPAVDGVPASGGALDVLKALLLAVVSDPSCHFFEVNERLIKPAVFANLLHS